jgi:acyl carrier protein
LRDRPLDKLTRDDLDEVLSPKLAGAQLLHYETLVDPLELFVLFSSVAAVHGSKGQANYAAANACLDEVARTRVRVGLPALSVNWGGWAGGGMAETVSEIVKRRWQAEGQRLILPSEGIAALEAALASNDPQVVVSGEPAVLEKLDAAPKGQTSVAATARGSEPRGRTLAEIVTNAVRRVLALSEADELSHTVPLRDLGMDSLMAVELRNELVAATGKRLSMTLAFDYPDVESLIRYLTEQEAPRAAPAVPSKSDIHDLGGAGDVDRRLAELERYFA